MPLALLERIIADEPNVPYQADDSFTYTYFAFIRYFQQLVSIEPDNVIISAHFTYGWMPTMLKLKHRQLHHAADILTQVKQRKDITDDELTFLISLINNSLVGVSKLLHFIDPERYAIWDSRVAAYFDASISSWRMHEPLTYRHYLASCSVIVKHRDFSPVHQSIMTKIGQPVSALRAIELVMYTNGTSPTN